MKIRKRKFKSGKVGWQLDLGMVDGKRWQKLFRTKQAAELRAGEHATERRRFGDVAVAMSHPQRLRYAAAEERLRAVGVTLEQAVGWAVERAAAVREPITIEAMREKFLRSKSRRRERYVDQLGVVLRGFVLGRELKLAHEVTTEEVQRWLGGNGWAMTTQRNYLGDVRGFFKWAKGERHVGVNPCDGIKLDARELDEEKEITAFSPEQIEALFATAVDFVGKRFDRRGQHYEPAHVFRPLLGYLTVATFCGVRPEEVKRTPRIEIDLEHRTFVVTAGRAKTRRRRVVDLPENAVAWLRYWAALCPDELMIVPKNFRKLWEALREAAGLKPAGWRPVKQRTAGKANVPRWPHDVLRHTAATMHYAAHQNAALLQAQLGHSEDEDTLFQRYRAVRLLDGRTVSKTLAAKFWAISPPVA